MGWFRKKPKNRRAGRGYVLDVKLRSSQVRAARARLAAMALGAIFATVLGIFLLWRAGEWALARLVYQNSAFAIREIDIQTDGVLAVDQIRRWAGVKPGDNLLALDLARVKRDLELAPAIASVSVERILPRALSVRVIEREAVAEVNVPRPHPGGGIEWARFWIDPDGFVMPPLEAGQRSAPIHPAAGQVPAISGLNPNEAQPGRAIQSPQMRAALELIQAFDKSAMAGWVELKRIDVSLPDVLLVTTDQGGEITFGLSHLETQLRRWRSIFDEALRQNLAVAQLDLAVSNNIPVKWAEAAAPVLVPKTPKTLKARKKHV